MSKQLRRSVLFSAVASAIGESVYRGLTRYMQGTGLMLSLIPVADSITAIPEAQRAWYVEKDGKFVLDPTKIGDDDIAGPGYKNTLKSEREAAAAAKREADAEKAARAELERKYASLGDPEKLRELLNTLEKDEEGRLIAAGKIDEVVALRTEKLRKDLEGQVTAAKTAAQRAADEKAAAEGRLQTFSQRALGFHVAQIAGKVGTHADALEDAVLAARAEGWTIDAESNPVLLDKTGQPVMGKDGSTPFTLVDWFEEKKATKKHWFPSQNNGGGGGGSGAGGRRDLSGLTATQRLTEARKAQH